MPYEYKSALAQAAGQAIGARPLISLPLPDSSSSSSTPRERSVGIQEVPNSSKLIRGAGENKRTTTPMSQPSHPAQRPPLVLEPKYRLFPQPDLREKPQRRSSLAASQRSEQRSQQEERVRPTRSESQTSETKSQKQDRKHEATSRLERTSASNSYAAPSQGPSTKTLHERRTSQPEPKRVSFQDSSPKRSVEASATVTEKHTPLPTAPPDTARAEKRRTMTTRQFDQECLDLTKSYGVRKLLRSATKEPTIPSSSLSFRLNTAIEPFRNLCICDPKIRGQPIKLKSRYFALSPRGLKVGACEFINLPLDGSQQLRPFLGIYHRPHHDNSPIYVLEYAAGLLSQESPCSEATYVLACQIDVTEFIKKLTYRMLAAKYQAEVEAERKAQQEAEQRKRGSIEIRHRDSAIMIDTSRNLSSLNLAGRASDRYKGGPVRSVRIEQPLEIIVDDEASSPINWLEIDNFPAPPKDRSLLPEIVKHELQSLLSTILSQYKDCFVLSPTSSLDGIFQAQSSSHWQISYTSHAVHAAKDDLRGALSKTKQEVLASLGAQLAANREIREVIRWGARGERKTLCAVPMVRDGSLGPSSWLCFLLDVK